MVNVFSVLKEEVERKTGYACAYLDDGARDGETIYVSIAHIALLESPGLFSIGGHFTIKSPHENEWEVLTSLFYLGLRGVEREANLVVYPHGFMGMSVNFSLLMQEEKGRVFSIKRYELTHES